jgi:Icc-related predicted phosphoesterase
MKKTIKVFAVIGSKICVAAEDGQKLFDLLYQAISDNDRLDVSFENIELITAAFLNTAVGQLYGVFSEETITTLVSYTHLEEADEELFRLVVANALRYYRKG